MTTREAKLMLYAALTGSLSAVAVSWVFHSMWSATSALSASPSPSSSALSDSEPDQDKVFMGWNICLCGQTRSCTFGPGIVGEQQCRTNASFDNVWSRCEPKQ